MRHGRSEDGGRAVAIEEGISALVFAYVSAHDYFGGIKHVDQQDHPLPRRRPRSQPLSARTGELGLLVEQEFRLGRLARGLSSVLPSDAPSVSGKQVGARCWWLTAPHRRPRYAVPGVPADCTGAVSGAQGHGAGNTNS
ncbi:hypothetical protein [Amycolatopsis pigmentata]|uniref:MazG C-terminal domain-containing protein n=1 Tax=Amycolatopsis pigmentata TaxID=450801 RepID=A0ABW5FLV9_9PSEU